MNDTLAPGFLIAVPQMMEPEFKQTVVFLLERNEEGAMGVVVNRESPLLLADLCDDHQISYSGDDHKLVRRGGPVSPAQGLVIYGADHTDPDGREVCEGLYVSASRGTLGRLCNLSSGRFHCYSGYAGWGPGQLEREIEEGAWVHAPADAHSVFDIEPENMWTEVLRNQGIEPGALVFGGSGEA